jgi:beta-N-acetylhexosaminidase
MHETADELLGQLFVIGFEGSKLSSRLRLLLTRIQPAGVILFARNIVSAEQTRQLLNDCQACASKPLLTFVDMEGGKVDRFRDVIGPAPSAAEVFATGDRKLFRKHGGIIGEACRTLGFNVDLAPVVDLAFEVSGKVMGSRVVSADPRNVTVYAREFLGGLRLSGVLGAIKHFPGLGEANLDTHHALPSVNKSWKKLWEQDISPYRALRREAPMVLVGHAAYPQVTRDRTPASLSRKWIANILREKVGYRGLVVSDDLEMGGVLKAAPIEQAALKFIRAGGDLCLICHSEERIAQSYNTLKYKVQCDAKFADRARESIARVLAFKKKRFRELGRHAPVATKDRVQKLSRNLWEFGEQVRLRTIEQRVVGWEPE